MNLVALPETSAACSSVSPRAERRCGPLPDVAYHECWPATAVSACRKASRGVGFVHQFLVVLANTDPFVWRRIQVPRTAYAGSPANNSSSSITISTASGATRQVSRSVAILG